MSTSPNLVDLALTVEQVAEATGVPEHRLRRLIKNASIDFEQNGPRGSIRIRQSQLEAVVAAAALLPERTRKEDRVAVLEERLAALDDRLCHLEARLLTPAAEDPDAMASFARQLDDPVTA